MALIDMNDLSHGVSPTSVADQLEEVGEYLAGRVKSGFAELDLKEQDWLKVADEFKELEIELVPEGRPRLVGKKDERVSELQNQLAHIALTVKTLKELNDENVEVELCNPTTNSKTCRYGLSADLVVRKLSTEEVWAIEVKHVIGGGNEPKPIDMSEVPDDVIVRRFLATNKEKYGKTWATSQERLGEYLWPFELEPSEDD